MPLLGLPAADAESGCDMARRHTQILGTGLLTLSLVACAGQADLGRTKTNELSFFTDLGDRVVQLAERANASANLPLTAEEAQLRTIARTIDTQAAQRRPDLLSRLIQGPEAADGEKSYYLALRQAHANSGASLLHAFGNDVLRDVAMIDQFANLSIAVTSADSLRLALVREAMEADSAVFSDAVDVVLRVEENGKVIDDMADEMSVRYAKYRIALEQSAFDIPERDLIATVDQALVMLEKSIEGIKGDAARHRAVRGELFGRRSAADRPV
ncbi:hypothetical protein QMT40_000973 [Parvibaculaceae bacterium PLY_AMNH_Bact1]|nr:hypothetical protein QMT40_000973 [Parvibaculaceae bacterium PLY_AMNH_Bact1]